MKEEDKSAGEQVPNKSSKNRKSKSKKDQMQLSVNAPIFVPIFAS
jgi:hypothetical protein